MRLPYNPLEEAATGARREILRAALPILQQNLAEMEEAAIQRGRALLAKGELTPEMAFTILSEVNSLRLLEQKFATAVELED